MGRFDTTMRLAVEIDLDRSTLDRDVHAALAAVLALQLLALSPIDVLRSWVRSTSAGRPTERRTEKEGEEEPEVQPMMEDLNAALDAEEQDDPEE